MHARKLVSRTWKQVSRNLGPLWQPGVYNDSNAFVPRIVTRLTSQSKQVSLLPHLFSRILFSLFLLVHPAPPQVSFFPKTPPKLLFLIEERELARAGFWGGSGRDLPTGDKGISFTMALEIRSATFKKDIFSALPRRSSTECTKIARFSAVAAAIFTAPTQNRAIFKDPRCAISSAKKIASERRFSLRLKGTNLIPTAEFPAIPESAAKIASERRCAILVH